MIKSISIAFLILSFIVFVYSQQCSSDNWNVSKNNVTFLSIDSNNGRVDVSGDLFVQDKSLLNVIDTISIQVKIKF